MVHALREATRVLTKSGILINVRPLTAPLEVAVVTAAETVWAKTIQLFSAPEDVAAAETAAREAVSRGWFVLQTSHPFAFEIHCDTVDELRTYVEARKLRGDGIPYDALQKHQRERSNGEAARLRCRRPWMLSTYSKT
ncbi:MAG TPA: hypothetical protein VN736_05665 [Candidatus Limnocylindrales bacterium]|nr:hypothetical protein [Candidatus Limnocylindrales bacterium]